MYTPFLSCFFFFCFMLSCRLFFFFSRDTYDEKRVSSASSAYCLALVDNPVSPRRLVSRAWCALLTGISSSLNIPPPFFFFAACMANTIYRAARVSYFSRARVRQQQLFFSSPRQPPYPNSWPSASPSFAVSRLTFFYFFSGVKSIRAYIRCGAVSVLHYQPPFYYKCIPSIQHRQKTLYSATLAVEIKENRTRRSRKCNKPKNETTLK